MSIRSNRYLPQVRKAMLAGASAMAICLAAPQAAQSGSLTIEGEGSWLKPFGDEVIYGARRTLGPTTDVNQTLDRGDDTSYRGQAIWRFNNSWSISVGGGAADFSSSDTAPSANLYTAAPFSFLFTQMDTVPDFQDNFPFALGTCPACEQVYTDATASLETDLDFIDFEVGKDVGIGTNGRARIFAGVRYARFDETLRGSFTNSVYSAFGVYYFSQTLTSTRKSSFDGIGPRIGLTAEMPIGNGKFSFGGNFAFAALFGEVESTTTSTHFANFPFFGTSATNNFTTTRTSQDDVIYTVEIAPQLNYHLGGNGNVSGKISVGYRFDQYLGIVDTATRQTAIADLPSGGDSNDDAKFDGFFARLSLTFGQLPE